MTTAKKARSYRLDEPAYRAALLAAALVYAGRGWHVFPLRPGDKRPAVPNHPAHLCDRSDPKCADGHVGWEQRATTDHDRIRTAWARRPYGIGIACGPSGLLVVDLDTASTDDGPAGAETWCRLTGGHPIIDTHTVATPSGGRHLYYRRPSGQALGNTASRLGPRVDTRGVGGYVVAPPTRIGQKSYLVTRGAPVVPTPTWLAEALAPTSPAPTTMHRRPTVAAKADSDRVRRYVAAAVDAEAHRLRAITSEGTRNITLFHAAIKLGQLVGAGILTQADAEQVLRDSTAHHTAIGGGYTFGQIDATIASGLNRGIQEPRQLPHDLARETAQS